MKLILPIFIILMTLCVQLVSGIHYVTIPVLMSEQSYSNLWIGAAMASEIAGLLLLHRALHAFVRWAGLSVALLVFVISRALLCLLMIQWHGYAGWLAGIFCYGLCTGMLLVLLQTWLNMLPLTKRGLWMGLFSAALSLGVALGPLLVSFTDLQTEQRFYLSAALNAPLLLLMWIGAAQSGLDSAAPARVRFVFRHARPVLISALVGGISFYGLPNFLTLYGISSGLSESSASILMSIFMLGSVSLGMLISLLSDWLNRQLMLVICIFVSVVCGVYLSLAMYSSQIATQILLYCWGGSMGGIYSIGLSLIGERFHPSQQLPANLSYNIMDSCGGIAGLLLIGLMMDQIGSEGLPLVIEFVGCSFLIYLCWELVTSERPLR